MKRLAPFLLLLLSIQPALAVSPLSNVEFSDGRRCNQCTVELKQGFVVSVKDNTGQEWLDPSKPMNLMVYKSGALSWSSHNYTSPVGAPKTESADNGYSAYWQKRYAELNSEIDLCAGTTGDKAMCLLQVKQIESQKDQALIQNQLQIQQVNAAQAQASAIRTQTFVQSLTAATSKPQPTTTQPTHTNCFAVGNQLNCNSY
jgi:hypothetical protein